MKRRIICLCVVVGVLLSACGIRKELLPEPAPQRGSYSEEKPLMAAVESEEEAKELAELYGIKLVDFSDRVATFYTEENLAEVIQRGKKNGWPLLEINYVTSAD